MQDICQNIDNKSDEIKWLVQTLDMLAPFYPNDAPQEQEKLDKLLLRYKSLLPTIEVTITRTDTFSKCYSYKKQVIEVSSVHSYILMKTDLSLFTFYIHMNYYRFVSYYKKCGKK